jgi:hypothetical protein
MMHTAILFEFAPIRAKRVYATEYDGIEYGGLPVKCAVCIK